MDICKSCHNYVKHLTCPVCDIQRESWLENGSCVNYNPKGTPDIFTTTITVKTEQGLRPYVRVGQPVKIDDVKKKFPEWMEIISWPNGTIIKKENTV